MYHQNIIFRYSRTTRSAGYVTGAWHYVGAASGKDDQFGAGFIYRQPEVGNEMVALNLDSKLVLIYQQILRIVFLKTSKHHLRCQESAVKIRTNFWNKCCK